MGPLPLLNTPLALLAKEAEALVAGVSRYSGRLEPKAANSDRSSRNRTYAVVSGAAVIPVRGILVQAAGPISSYGYVTGYDGIREAFLGALDDPEARSIIFDIDSPGGETSGLFDLVDTIYGARGAKPIEAVLSEYAFSAAYAIASAANRITVPRTGGTGSVGVVMIHADISRALSDGGINVTLIRYGERKFEGSEFEPLSRAARASIHADIDVIGDLFVRTVARNRGLKAATVRATQAATFLGRAGVDAGLADVVAAPDDAFRTIVGRQATTAAKQARSVLRATRHKETKMTSTATPGRFAHLRPVAETLPVPTAAERAQARAGAIAAAAARAGAPIPASKPAAGSVAAQIIAAAAKARRPTGDGEPEAVRIAKGGR